MTEREAIALHEGAHFVTAAALGINSCPVVFDGAQESPQAGRVLLGQCSIDPGARLTAFQAAVIAWSGVIAEGLLGIEHTLPQMPFPLTRATMRDWHRAAMTRFERLSFGDQMLISRHQRSTWTTFRAAYRIVARSKRRIQRLAQSMINQQEGRTMFITRPTTYQQARPPETESAAARAHILRNFLAGLPAEHPDRPALSAALRLLERGVDPPATVFERTPQVEPTAPDQ